ncbi:MAG: ATP-binding protein [Blautia wexlerae]
MKFVFDYEKDAGNMHDYAVTKAGLAKPCINVLDGVGRSGTVRVVQKIFIRLQKRNDLVRMEIEDQGIGIPQNEYHKIFQRFYRGSSREVMEKSGTGIGLFLSEKLSKNTQVRLR